MSTGTLPATAPVAPWISDGPPGYDSGLAAYPSAGNTFRRAMNTAGNRICVHIIMITCCCSYWSRDILPEPRAGTTPLPHRNTGSITAGSSDHYSYYTHHCCCCSTLGYQQMMRVVLHPTEAGNVSDVMLTSLWTHSL